MDDLHRDSHGSYGGRAPMDYGAGTGAGMLFVVMLLGAIVLASFFLGNGGGPATGATPMPPAAPAAQN